MDIPVMVERWKTAVVTLALAHSKDEADRAEASIEECLTPILAAPIKQVREFAQKLLEALRDDPRIPFLLWRGYEKWVECVAAAPDEEIKQLKTELAKQIADLVESDLQLQLGDAVVRALQWRSPSDLVKLKTTVEKEKASGKSVRLRGRESCLFIEAGGSEEEPEVCVQL